MAGSQIDAATRKLLWSQPSEKWETLFRNAPHGAPQSVRPTGMGSSAKIIMACILPTHADRNASAACFPAQGWYRCMSGQCNAKHTDPVKLHSLAFGMTYAQSLSALYKHFDLKRNKVILEAAKAFERDSAIFEAILTASRAALNATSIAPQSAGHELYRPALNYLSSRNVLPSTLVALEGGVFPTLADIVKYVPKRTKAGPVTSSAVRDFFGVGVFPADPDEPSTYTGALLFCYRPLPGVLGGFKLRTLDGSGGYYESWLMPASIDEKGFFGWPSYTTALAHQSGAATPAVDIIPVEGEFDACSQYQARIANTALPMAAVLSGAGGSVDSINELATLETNRIILMGDNDAGGRGFVHNIAAAYDLAEELYAYQYEDTAPVGADPDDMVQAANASAFFSSFDDQVVPLSDWLAQEFYDGYTALEARSPKGKVDTKDLKYLLKQYTYVFANPILRATFEPEIQHTTVIAPTLLRAVLPFSVKTPIGYAQHLQAELLVHMEPLYVQETSALIYQNKHTRQVCALPLGNVQSIMTHLISGPLKETGAGSVFEHMNLVVGLPTFVSSRDGKQGLTARSYNEQIKEFDTYLARVCREGLVSLVPTMDNMEVLRQGVHCLSTDGAPDRFFGKQRAIHIVNGTHHFSATISLADDAPKVVWRKATSCTPWPDVLFLYDNEPWSQFLVDEDVLNSTQITHQEAKDALHTLEDAIQRSWYLTDEGTSARYIATAAMTMIIQNLSVSVLNMHVTGPSASGKSSLLQGLFYAKNDISTLLVEHSHGTGSYTEAGLRQDLGGDARLYCIEEFEAGGNEKKLTNRNRVVLSFLETIREMSSGFRHNKFNVEAGNSKPAYIKAAIATTGIDQVMAAQDANRRVAIGMRAFHDRGQAFTPLNQFAQLLDADACARLRRICTLYALQNVQEIVRLHKVHADTMYEAVKDANTDSLPGANRLLRNMAMQTALLEHLGEDAETFARTMLQRTIASIRQTTSATKDDLFYTMFDTPLLDSLDDVGIPLSIRALTSTRASLAQLNTYDCGVYYLAGHDHVIVVFPKVADVLLRNTRYRMSQNPVALVREFQRVEGVSISSQHLTTDDLEALNKFTDVRTALGLQRVCFVPLTMFSTDTKKA